MALARSAAISSARLSGRRGLTAVHRPPGGGGRVGEADAPPPPAAEEAPPAGLLPRLPLALRLPPPPWSSELPWPEGGSCEEGWGDEVLKSTSWSDRDMSSVRMTWKRAVPGQKSQGRHEKLSGPWREKPSVTSVQPLVFSDLLSPLYCCHTSSYRSKA